MLHVSHSVVSDPLQPHELYVAHQAPLSMRFSRQEYWSGLPFPTPGIFVTQGGKTKLPDRGAATLQIFFPNLLVFFFKTPQRGAEERGAIWRVHGLLRWR